jgi:hypothetical protein
LQQTIEGLMGNPYFPVGIDAMGAERRFLDLGEGSTNINGAMSGDLRVRFDAKPVRRELLEGTALQGKPRLGVGARSDAPIPPISTEKKTSS